MSTCILEPHVGLGSGLWDGFQRPFSIVCGVLFGRGPCDNSWLYDVATGLGVIVGIFALYFVVKLARFLLGRTLIWIVYGPETLKGVNRARQMEHGATTGYTTAHKDIPWERRLWIVWLLGRIQRRRPRVSTA